MKKSKSVENMSNTNDPNITLVWEFRWSNIYIMWDKFKAKEFSEYMELWFQAIKFIDEKYPDPLIPKKKK